MHPYIRQFLGVQRRVAHGVLDVRRHASLRAVGEPRGEVLLSYILDPFTRGSRKTWAYHTNYWESSAIASTYRELGFNVDVIDYANRTFLPRKSYDVFIDSRHNMERLHERFPKAIRIQHLDTSSLLFHNLAEARRLYDLQQRRGVTLQPRRHERPNRGLEIAHCGTLIGNETTAETWRWARKPLYTLPLPSRVEFDWPAGKDFERARTSFVWLASGGMVHKGLDLVLEAFARLPHLTLTVCGPVEEETDFVAAYRDELFGLPNIRLHGWIDVESADFRRIADSAAATVYASCSESQAGAVATAMHASLIPIVSRESGIDVPPGGIRLESSTVDEIVTAVEMVSRLSAAELQEAARASWTAARETMTRENYRRAYRRAAEEILGRDWA
jgi:glycosyltransferase involved in cell wall biosynthesis